VFAKPTFRSNERDTHVQSLARLGKALQDVENFGHAGDIRRSREWRVNDLLKQLDGGGNGDIVTLAELIQV
jgi:hypothetical protein